MKTIRRIVIENQLLSFFSLTYFTSWLLFLPVFLMGDQQAYGILALIGLFCPALINIFVSRIITNKSVENPRSRRAIAFFLAWILSTAVFSFHVEITSGIGSPFAVIIYAVIALIPASIIAAVYSKFPTVRASLSSILHPRGHIVWYLFALLLPWIVKWISVPITNRLGWQTLSMPDPVHGTLRLFEWISVSFMYILLFAGGLNEEAGWTGFALPRLQARWNPLIASVFLWFFWILWHIPMQLAGFWNPDLVDFIRALIGTFFARFIFTWLFNKTKGGVLSAMLFHASANASFEFLPATYIHMILEAAIAIVIIFAARMWQKLPEDSPGVYRPVGEII